MTELAGRRVLVTAGPTRARIDAVRFVSNTSTGRLGATIAREALNRGASVVYVHGPSAALPLDGHHERLELHNVLWVHDLFNAAKPVLEGGAFDAIVHSMAVLDYAPRSPKLRKTGSGADAWNIVLEPVPKLLPLLRQWHPGAVIVGFKLEWRVAERQLISAARKLLVAHDLQLVVANDLSLISEKAHPAVILAKSGTVATAHTKTEVAQAVLDQLSRRFAHE